MMILLLIDERATEIEGNVVFNIYSGEMTITKAGNLSGKYKKISNEEVEKLSVLLDKHEFYWTGQHSVSANIEKLFKLKNKEIIVGYEHNRKIIVLSDKNKISLKNLSLDKNKLFLVHGTDVIKLEEKHHVFLCGKYTICLIKNRLYAISGKIDKKVLKQVIFSKRPKSEIGMGDLFVKHNDANTYLTCKDVKIQIEIIPKKHKIYALPQVLYFGHQAKIHSEKTVLIDGDIYYRDYISERKIKVFFKAYEMTSPDIYIIPSNKIYHEIKKMIENGFEVVMNQKKLHIYDEAFKQVQINSGIDWFELDGNIQFDNDSIKIADLIGSDDFYVEGRNRMILVPDNISSILKVADINGHIEKTANNYTFLVENTQDNIFDTSAIKNLFDEDVPLKLSDEMFGILYDYQFDGVVWLKSVVMHGYGGCLADDMGLGKTLQILSLLSDEDVRHKYKKILIIVPRTLLGNWVAEYEKFFGNRYKMDIYYGDNRKINSEIDVYITTYGMVVNDYEFLTDFDLFVLDEAQKIKNVVSKTRKIIKRISVGKTVIAATGTPYENNVSELWSIMDIVNTGMLGTHKEFCERYLNTEDQNLITELSHKVSPFLLRRTKNEVLEDLPQKKIQNIYCMMDTKQQKLYNAMLIKIKKDLHSISEPGAKKLQMLNGLTFLREICCHPKLIQDAQYQKCTESTKLNIIVDLVKDSIDENEKIVVFSQFTRFLGIIADELKRENIEYCYIDGQTQNRQKEIEEFEDESKKVFLISLKAGGFGLNLTNAKRLIISDPWWNPAVERQAEDRIYRIGQTDDVTIYRLIVKNTVEEKIEVLKNTKDEVGDLLFANVKEITDLTPEELLKMFK